MSSLEVTKALTKGAFIIYLEGGYDDFEGEITLFPSYDLGGAVENSNENNIEHGGGRGGGQPFFFLKRKGNENMLLDLLIIRSCLLCHFDKMMIQN